MAQDPTRGDLRWRAVVDPEVARRLDELIELMADLEEPAMEVAGGEADRSALRSLADDEGPNDSAPARRPGRWRTHA